MFQCIKQKVARSLTRRKPGSLTRAEIAKQENAMNTFFLNVGAVGIFWSHSIEVVRKYTQRIQLLRGSLALLEEDEVISLPAPSVAQHLQGLVLYISLFFMVFQFFTVCSGIR